MTCCSTKERVCMEQNKWKRYAFISYNHHDVKMAKWLHKRLEAYKLPTEIHNEFEDSKYLRPVFRDQEDLNTGILSDELRKHLESSKYLIFICSPNSAKSEWVNSEVKAFIEWGRLEYIIPFIIDGAPNAVDAEECFPASLREYVAEHPEKELLGINVSEVGREKAFVRVVSRMLEISFDELWKRHERERRKQVLVWTMGTLIAVALICYFAVPISLNIKVVDDNHHLPMPDDAVLVIANAEYPLHCLDTTITVIAIPGYYRARTLSVSFSATYYQTMESSVRLGFGLRNAISVSIVRDGTFSIYEGTIIDNDGNPIVKADVGIGDSMTVSDANGHFRITFATEDQSETKAISIRKPGMKEIRRTDECPSEELKYIMHKAALDNEK